MRWIVAAVTAWVGGCCECFLETVEIWERSGFTAVDGDDTVFVLFHGVLIDETAGVDASHVGGVERGNFTPVTSVGVATILGQAR